VKKFLEPETDHLHSVTNISPGQKLLHIQLVTQLKLSDQRMSTPC